MSKKAISNSLSLIAGSSMFVLFGLIVSKLLNYAYRVIIARAYGPEEYGLFTLATTVLGIGTALALFGTSDATVRFIAVSIGKNKIDEAAYQYKFVKRLVFALSIIIASIVFFGSELLSNIMIGSSSLVTYLQIFSIAIIFTASARPALGAIRAFGYVGWYSFIFNIVQNLSKVIILLILIWIGYVAESIAISYLAGTFIVFFMSFIVVRNKAKELYGTEDIAYIKKKEINKRIVFYSWPLLFFGIAHLSLYWVDSIFLGNMKGAEIVGIYNAAVPLAILVLAIPEMFMQLFVPLISKHYARKKYNIMLELSKQITKWIIFIILPITSILIIFPEFPLKVLFGSDYLVAALPLTILSIGTLILSVSFVSQNILTTIGKTKLLLGDIVLALILNIILNYLLIPLPKVIGIVNDNGMIGASVATVISYSVLSGLFMLQAKNAINAIPMRRKSINILISAILSLLIIYFVSPFVGDIFVQNSISYYIINIILYFITYLLFNIKIFRALDLYDLEILKPIFGKFIKI